MITIDVSSLSSGIHSVELHPDAEEADLDPTTFDDIQVEAELQCHRDRILVTMHASGTATLMCDRTLQPFEEQVDGTYSVLFGPPSMVGREGEAFDEVRPFDPADQEIDMTDVVRDTLLLALPQRRIAPGAEDEPIESEFGAPDEEEEEDRPVDPRWSELEKLKNNDEAS